MAYEEDLGITMLLEARGEVAEVLTRLGAELCRVEAEEDSTIEGDDDPLPDPLDRCARDRDSEFLGLLVHLPADDSARGSSTGRTDDRTARCRASSLTDGCTDGRTTPSPDDSPLLEPTHARTAS